MVSWMANEECGSEEVTLVTETGIPNWFLPLTAQVIETGNSFMNRYCLKLKGLLCMVVIVNYIKEVMQP